MRARGAIIISVRALELKMTLIETTTAAAAAAEASWITKFRVGSARLVYNVNK